MSAEFEHLKQTWFELGRDDPLWAVLSLPDKRGGKWSVDEFLQTGEREVAGYHRLLREHAGAGASFDEVLDFGSGVGRLCLAWSRRSRAVTGVDISASMIARAQSMASGVVNVRFVLNEKPDLAVFADHRFELVASHICLQHIPWNIAALYIAEFGRVCRPGGFVAFQMLSRLVKPNRRARARKFVVEHLPFGLGNLYRRLRHGTGVAFEMYFTVPEKVVAVASAAGLREVHREPDGSGGSDSEGFIYVFRKEPSAISAVGVRS